MRTVVVFATVLAAALALPADTYNPELESLDAEEIVKNPRFLQSYGKCFLSEGPCTSEGTEITKLIPEAVEKKCDKCSPKQRQLVRTFVRGFQNNTPEVWDKLKKKYDPNDEHTEDFKSFMDASD